MACSLTTPGFGSLQFNNRFVELGANNSLDDLESR